MWLIQCPTTMWQIQSLLRCSTIYKARYDVALLTKPIATWHIKARYYTAIFYKISKSFLQNPNTNLTFILQSPNTNLASILQPNTNLALFFTKPKY